MSLGSFLIGDMLVGKTVIEDTDRLVASHVAGRLASWLLWIAEVGHLINPPDHTVHAYL